MTNKTKIQTEDNAKTGNNSNIEGIQDILSFLLLDENSHKMSALINKALNSTKSKLKKVDEKYNKMFPRFKVP